MNPLPIVQDETVGAMPDQTKMSENAVECGLLKNMQNARYF